MEQFGGAAMAIGRSIDRRPMKPIRWAHPLPSHNKHALVAGGKFTMFFIMTGKPINNMTMRNISWAFSGVSNMRFTKIV
jgi:hypothetical protein